MAVRGTFAAPSNRSTGRRRLLGGLEGKDLAWSVETRPHGETAVDRLENPHTHSCWSVSQ